MSFFIVAWFLGVFLSVQMIAAWYGIIDYRYRMKRFARQVLLRVVGWSALYVIVYAALPPGLQVGLSGGVKFLLVTQLIGMLMSIGVVLRLRSISRRSA